MGPCNEHSGIAKAIEVLSNHQTELKFDLGRTNSIIDKIHVKVLVILVSMCGTMMLLLINFILKHYTSLPTIASATEAFK
jgi:hypothetical protein